MGYNLKIGVQTIQVKDIIRNEETLLATIGEQRFAVRYQIISANHIHMNINGSGKNIYLSSTADGKLINANGVTYLVQDTNATSKRSVRKHGDKGAVREITPLIPSVVVRVLVGEGEWVEEGDGVVVVSAMKMETTLTAPFKGMVLKINVAEGDRVMPGQILVDVESEEESAGQEPQDALAIKRGGA